MRWADSSGFDGEIIYFFESGHKDQAVSNMAMTQVFRDEQMRRTYRYSTHKFADKRKMLGLQAADILAWQTRKYEQDCVLTNTRKPRKDFVELIRPHDMMVELGAMRLAELYAWKAPRSMQALLSRVMALVASRR